MTDDDIDELPERRTHGYDPLFARLQRISEWHDYDQEAIEKKERADQDAAYAAWEAEQEFQRKAGAPSWHGLLEPGYDSYAFARPKKETKDEK